MKNIFLKGSIILTMSALFSIDIYAEPLSTVETTSIELISKSRSGRTTLDYTYQATFINSGADASNVTGFVSSTSPNIQVIENEVVIGDLDHNELTTSSDTFTLRIDRQTPFDSGALEWAFDSVAPISLDVGSTELVMNEGDVVNLSYTVSYTAIDGSVKTVLFNQDIQPGSGIGLVTDAPPSWSSSSTQDWIVNGTLSSISAGNYIITSTANILETGETASVDTLVTVLPENQLIFSLHAPQMAPGGIQLNQSTEVFFSAQLDIENGAPEHLTLEEIDGIGQSMGVIGLLFDNGLNGDVSANDGMFGATFPITSNSLGDKLYRVSFFDGSETVYSESTNLAVVDFPTDTAVSSSDMLIESEDPLIKVYADHIIVGFHDDVPPSLIKEVVEEVGGTIIGSISDLNIIQVGFEKKTLMALHELITAYSVQSEVEFAELSYEVTLDAVYPNDAGSKNVEVTRVDEIWLLAQKGLTIAVVDTGVDYNHSDLDVIKGKDFIDNDMDPFDAHGHGTMVSGVAAAKINNGSDIAGVSNSKVLAVRALTATGASSATLADAIKWAATKVKIINISGGFYGSADQKALEKVLSKLAGKVIVSTAGNGGISKKRYPCANSNVFCVGSSSDSDTRSSFSNYGSWVDIAAPGENVKTTKLNGGTASPSGTSFAAPLVAGAASVIWSEHSSWSASKVKQRLLDTAEEAAGLKGKLIGNRIDVFEAFFNGDFELGLEEWKFKGTCSPKSQLGPIKPKSGKKMAFCTTGPAGDQVAAELSKELNFIADSDFTIKFWYNFVSEEYPEFVGTQFDDSLKIKLIAPNGTETLLAEESINSSNFQAVSGIDFPGGDSTVGQLQGGWKEVSKTIAVKKGMGSYKIVIEDAGDDIYDTAVLLDQVRLK